ncbi:MAG TPA: glycosyltransferase family 2 protein [Vicinamibacterales bacterium]
MSVAVLIVNFRGYDDLDRCLGSVAPEIRKSDEVIVVDNESDEARLEIVRARHPGIVTVPSAVNLGFAAGVNLAARHATAPFLLLLNPDTIVQGPLLSVLDEWLCAHPDVAVAGPRILNGDGSTQPSARRFPGFSTVFGGRSAWLTRKYPGNWWSRRNLLGLDIGGPLDVDWLAGSCLMTRRSVFERLGGLDEAFFLYWEDADYCWRVAATGGRRTYVPAAAVAHLGGRSARYDLPRAIRSFHASAFHLYSKRCRTLGKLSEPLVRAGLYLRGELRVGSALRDIHAGAAASRRAAGITRPLALLGDANDGLDVAGLDGPEVSPWT